jgi:diketogulonate reductase-like aldo/keto reductase
MKHEIVRNVTLPKIGFGTWKIGGGSQADPDLDSISLTALRFALEVGYTHFDTAEMYASGHSEELVGRAIRESGRRREDVFITSKVHPKNLIRNKAIQACEDSLRRLGTDYIDLYLIHWHTAGTKLDDTFRDLNKLVRDGRVKHLGVSNFDLKLLRQSQELSETPILTNQVPYSLSDRSYVENGVLDYCRQNDILLTAYSPVDEGNLRPNQTLEAIAKAHNATIFQIVLAWLVMQPRVITIPMSFNRQHIRENFDAAEIELTQSEIDQLTNG